MSRQCHTIVKHGVDSSCYKNETMTGLLKLTESDHIIKYPPSSLRLAPHNVLHSLVYQSLGGGAIHIHRSSGVGMYRTLQGAPM